MPLPTSMTADLDHVLQHAGSAVVWRDASIFGRLNERETELLDVSGTDTTLRKTILLVRQLPAGAAIDDEITVAGVPYFVRDIGRVRNDGLRPITLAENR
jgi:hypothetical protein